MNKDTFIKVCKDMGFTVEEREVPDDVEYHVVVKWKPSFQDDSVTVAYLMKDKEDEKAYAATFIASWVPHFCMIDGRVDRRFVANDLEEATLRSALQEILDSDEHTNRVLNGNVLNLKHFNSLFIRYERLADSYPIVLKGTVKQLLSDLEVARINTISTGTNK